MTDRELAEVVEVLSAADPLHGNHRQALLRVQQLQQQPSFFACCASIFASASMAPFVRLQSGFQIKNNIMNPLCIQNPAVRDHVTQAVGDSDGAIRKNASAVISAAVRNGAWDVAAVVRQLVGMLQAAGFSNPGQAHGCVLALSQIVEDAVQLLDAQGMSPAVINALCPCVMYEGNEKIRLNALIGLSVFLEHAGVDRQSASYKALHGVVLQLMQCFLSNLQQPMSTDISEKAIKCLVLSLTFHEQISQDLFFQVAQLMLHATQVDPDTMETVRIEAVEFWRAVLYFPTFAELVFPALGQIVPLLVDGMVYSRMELGMLQANEKDAGVPDRQEDLKPRHYEARTQSMGDEDEDDDDDEVEDFNLRRVSASTLDDIAEYYGDRVLESVLGVINQKMQPSQDWRHLEAAVLALGAIAEGCFEGLRPSLEAITASLLNLLETPTTHFLVVNIAVWALRRVAPYLLHTTDASGVHVAFRRYVTSLLAHMQAQSKLVQEAATSALTDICDQADDGQLNDFLVPIAQTVNACLAGYQLKNRVLLFEQIESLCRRFEHRIAEGEVLNLFIDPLVVIWQQTANDSPLLFAFFTCMSSVCMAIGPHIQPMARGIFDRALGVYTFHMNARQAALATNEDPPEFEFIVTSVDLLSGLFDALGSSLEPLVQANQPAFVQMTLVAIVDPLHEIRQAGFALLGDLAKACPRYVQECLPQIIQAIHQNCQNVDDLTCGCISNAAWCLQELLEHQLDMDQLPTLQLTTMGPIAMLFLRILVQNDLTAAMKNMVENIVLLVGSFLHAEPTLLTHVQVSVDQFIKRYLEYARNIRKGDGRFNAARGVLLALQQQPQAVRHAIPMFLDYANNLSDCHQDDVKKAVIGILTALSSGAPQEWAQAIHGYSPQVLNKLYVTYGVR